MINYGDKTSCSDVPLKIRFSLRCNITGSIYRVHCPVMLSVSECSVFWTNPYWIALLLSGLSCL